MDTLFLTMLPLLIILALSGILRYRAATLQAAIRKEDRRVAAFLRRRKSTYIRRIY